MTSITGVLSVVTPSGTERFEWNGIQADRDKARNEFQTRMETGTYLASVKTADKSWTQVRSFSEVEAFEQQQGKVEAKISPALVGG
jgi:hypothetical protein